MNYPLASSTWDDDELQAIQQVVDSGRFTMGPRVQAFEQEFAEFFGSRFAVMVNSGSSANLLAIAALCYRRENPLRPGDEVIVPAVSWSTTYYPVHQYGLRLKFVDISLEDLNLDLDAVEAAIGPKTRAIFAVNLLGAPNDFARLQEICTRHDLIFLEDNCESMGATFQDKQAGTFGEVGTFSMFFSHHISTMEGGMLITDDEELYHLALSLRAHGWTRQLPAENQIHTKSDDPFYEHFHFVLPGYNLRPLEMSGAIGSCQLRKLPALLDGRRENARHFQKLFAEHPDVVTQQPSGESSWFGFSFILKGRLGGHRDALINTLNDQGIETRPIVGGNFVKNPVIQYLDHQIHGDLTNAETIEENGFFIGNHHYDLRPQLDHLKSLVDDFIPHG